MIIEFLSQYFSDNLILEVNMIENMKSIFIFFKFLHLIALKNCLYLCGANSYPINKIKKNKQRWKQDS